MTGDMRRIARLDASVPDRHERASERTPTTVYPPSSVDDRALLQARQLPLIVVECQIDDSAVLVLGNLELLLHSFPHSAHDVFLVVFVLIRSWSTLLRRKGLSLSCLQRFEFRLRDADNVSGVKYVDAGDSLELQRSDGQSRKLHHLQDPLFPP